MRNEGTICSIVKGCSAITALMPAQKYIKLGTVRMALKNTNLHNRKFPAVINQLNFIDNSAIVRQILVVTGNCNSIGD